MNKGEYYKVSNLLDENVVDHLKASFEEKAISDSELNSEYGRICVFGLRIPDEVMEKLEAMVYELFGISLEGRVSLAVEYNSRYGVPYLPPHFDGDQADILINYQLSSNTSWKLGLNTEAFDLEDNSAIIFNANANVHWRPEKEFKEGEYIRMVFFRFYQRGEMSDYSHLNYDIHDPIFDDVHAFRNSISG